MSSGTARIVLTMAMITHPIERALRKVTPSVASLVSPVFACARHGQAVRNQTIVGHTYDKERETNDGQAEENMSVVPQRM